MKNLTSIAIFFIVACALSTGAQCEEVFRCGDSYSQKPCANAVVVNVDDARSSEQKAQADAVTRRELATANAMEKARLKEEAQLRERNAKTAFAQARAASKPKSAANSTAKGKASAASAKTKPKKTQPKKKKEPESFGGSTAGERPKAATSSQK